MNLDALRQQIDACDRKIVAALNERAKLVLDVGRIKREEGMRIFAPEREQAVYDKVAGLSEGPLISKHLNNIYREIISSSISLEAPTRISYLGPEGTFTHAAARQRFGSGVEYQPAPQIRDVFLAVAREHADYGVVPIENSTEGSVTATCDMFMESDLKICAEIFLPVRQNLLAMCERKEIQLLVSHPIVFGQCRNWLAANLPVVPCEPVASTAIAAEHASYKRGVAAIAGDAAAALYDFTHIERGIEDNPNNMTRFVVLSTSYTKPSGDDRTSILFSARHEAGSLYHALEPFNRRGVNLTRIESRPSKKINWEYSFFVDLEGHMDEPLVAETLAEIRATTDDFRILGSYPRARHVVAAPPPA